MNVKDYFEFIVNQLISKSSCGRLSADERNAIRIIRKFMDNNNE